MSRHDLGIIEFTGENRMGLWTDTTCFKNIADINGKFKAIYGFDNACGYFLQLFPSNDDAKEWMRDMEIYECYISDSMFDGLTGIELAYFIRMFHGNSVHSDLASLDMPF